MLELDLKDFFSITWQITDLQRAECLPPREARPISKIRGRAKGDKPPPTGILSL